MAINIFEYQSYRSFLKSWLENAKKEKISNLNKLSDVCRVHPTFLSHVLRGTKELSLEQAILMSEYFGFTQLEQDYFFSIIQMEKAGHHTLKKYYQNKIDNIQLEKNKLSQRFNEHKELSIEQRAIFYSSWIYAAVMTSTDICKGQTVDEVAKRFQITREKAENVLSFLVQTGLCNEKSGVYSLGENHIHVSNESHFVSTHHINYRFKAIQKMDTRENIELFFTSPMSLSSKDFERIREKLNIFVKEVISIAIDSESEDVVCFNIDFFKIR